MLDFPNTPAVGDVFTLPSGLQWQWDNTKWAPLSPSTGNVVTSVNGRAGAVQLGSADISGGGGLLRSGGTMTGGLVLAADPVGILDAVTKRYSDTKLALAGGALTGPLILAADPTTALGAATKQYVDAQVGSYLPIAGGTITGNLTVNGNTATAGTVSAGYVTSSGNVNAAGTFTGGAVSVNGGVTCQGSIMCATGTFYVANNTNYYLARNGSDGAWRFVENGTVNATIDTGGSITARGQVNAGSSLGPWGVVGSAMGLGWWMNFNWDGTNVPAYANGNYACTLVSSTWVSNNFKGIGAYTPNQNVDVNSSPQFQDLRVNGGYGVVYTGISGEYVGFYTNAQPFLVARTNTRGDLPLQPLSSDARLKRNVVPAGDALASLASFRVVEFDMQWPHSDSWHHRFGLIADDLEGVAPDCVLAAPSETSYKSLNLLPLVGRLVKAVQQLSARVVQLEAGHG
jgi:hypothetical protein